MGLVLRCIYNIIVRHLIVLIYILACIDLLLLGNVHVDNFFESDLLFKDVEHLLGSCILCEGILVHDFAHHFVIYHHVIHLLVKGLH